MYKTTGFISFVLRRLTGIALGTLPVYPHVGHWFYQSRVQRF